MQNHFYGSRQLNFERWSHGGDVSSLGRSFGQYPNWTLPAAAGFMFLLCFLISWWVEATYIKWWIRRRSPDATAVYSQITHVVGNANALSYALLAAISIGMLAWLSR
jgi:hypothetical protein